MKRELDTNDITTIQSTILNWYQKNGRNNLPWRNLESRGIDVPYGVLVSEFMLQQTQVDRVRPKFEQFMADYPTIQSLAVAPLSSVLSDWSGLGYNRRAVLLKQAAQEIVTTCNGIIPQDQKILMGISGIGPYTSAAIMSFGYNIPVTLIDTNIERFYELLFYGYDKPIKEDLTHLAEAFVPIKRSREWHSALMDLMTIIRSIRTPTEQQQKLLLELKLKPTWELPKLNKAPLVRPKQSSFKNSRRYFRGLILAALKNNPNHQSDMKQIQAVVEQHNIPQEYSLEAMIIQLKRDGLLVYTGALRSDTIINYPA